MIILTIYTIGLVLWVIALLIQQRVIDLQREIIDSQTEIIHRQEVKQGLSDIIIKEQKELSEMQKDFIEQLIKNDSASEAYLQTFKEGEKERCSELSE